MPAIPARSRRLLCSLVRVGPALGAATALALTSPFVAVADEEQRDAIARRTAELRELPPLAEIDDEVITRAELTARLPGLIAEDYSREEAEADARGLIALGLLPEGSDLWDLSLGLLGDQVAGYWDQKTDQMVVVSASGEDAIGPLEEFTYAHEVVHALQDAHLGLDGIMDDSLDADADGATAFAALVEGDATIASYDYLAGSPELAAGIAMAPMAAGGDGLDAAPAALAVSLVFPYLTGAEFVAALREQGGWAAVDAAYADPPVSTEQVMHPDKYLERDDPTAVALPDLAPALGDGWTLVDEDVAGELSVALLLADLQPGEGFNPFTGEIRLPAAARNAAEGWDGDRYALWANGDAEVLVWSSVWDRDEDATAFARALRAQTERRFSGIYEGETGNDVAMETPERAARILQSGPEVVYVLAPDLPTADAAMGALR